MLWATKQTFPVEDVCICEFTTAPDDGPKLHDETCARHHSERCRLAYRPDLTLPKHLPFGWGKHVRGCCCTIADYAHECICECPCVPR